MKHLLYDAAPPGGKDEIASEGQIDGEKLSEIEDTGKGPCGPAEFRACGQDQPRIGQSHFHSLPFPFHANPRIGYPGIVDFSLRQLQPGGC
jgi:hypothetical protein